MAALCTSPIEKHYTPAGGTAGTRIPHAAIRAAVLLLGETLSVAGGVGCLLILVAIGGLGRWMEQPPAQ
jgi:drug/metabolite transporter (DMT)-like permease